MFSQLNPGRSTLSQTLVDPDMIPRADLILPKAGFWSRSSLCRRIADRRRTGAFSDRCGLHRTEYDKNEMSQKSSESTGYGIAAGEYRDMGFHCRRFHHGHFLLKNRRRG